MRIMKLGKTQLPMDVIQDYLESLRPIYTLQVRVKFQIRSSIGSDALQAYDLWRHNCNNFSNDFATFLVGKGVPDYVSRMPDIVMNSAFGRMFRPAVDDMLKNSHNRRGGLLGLADESNRSRVPPTSHQRQEAVKTPTTVESLNSVLAAASNTCAIIFFTFQTCPPCKTMHPMYDELASEFGHKCTFIKVDVSQVPEASQKYSIRGTPTFVTFLRGEEERRWSGASPTTLKGNVKILAQMAWPPHPHESLRLPKLRIAAGQPVIYRRVPPLDKLLAKIGLQAQASAVQGVKHFILAAQADGAAESTLPDLDGFSHFLRSATEAVPKQNLFAVYDLLRVSMADIRVSGYFAEEKDHKTIAKLLGHVNHFAQSVEECPYALKLVALQTSCNLFSSPLYVPHILGCETLRTPIVTLITSSLIDDKHHSVRVAAASLVLNIASANARIRCHERREALPEDDEVELAAGLLETISAEEDSPEAFKGFMLALGQLTYCAPRDGQIADLLKAMDAKETIESKRESFPKEGLVDEIRELLTKLE